MENYMYEDSKKIQKVNNAAADLKRYDYAGRKVAFESATILAALIKKLKEVLPEADINLEQPQYEKYKDIELAAVNQRKILKDANLNK